MILDEIIQRLGQALDSTGKGKGELATALEVTPQTLRNWRSGENFPNKNRWEKIEEVTEVSLDWIFLGDTGSRAQNGLEAQILKFYRGAGDRGQEVLMAAANDFYAKEHPEDGPANPYGKDRRQEALTVQEERREGWTAPAQQSVRFPEAKGPTLGVVEKSGATRPAASGKGKREAARHRASKPPKGKK